MGVIEELGARVRELETALEESLMHANSLKGALLEDRMWLERLEKAAAEKPEAAPSDDLPVAGV